MSLIALQLAEELLEPLLGDLDGGLADGRGVDAGRAASGRAAGRSLAMQRRPRRLEDRLGLAVAAEEVPAGGHLEQRPQRGDALLAAS